MQHASHPHDGEHLPSLWQATASFPPPAPLPGDVNADVCIVGAGIVGLSAAYELLSEDRSVVVIDDGPIGGGMTGRSSAHLSNALDDRYFKLERLLGLEHARLAAESHTTAIDRIAAIVAQERIDCSFERLDGYLFNPPGGDPVWLEDEYNAAVRAGVSVDRVPRAPLAEFETGAALRFANQGQFHPVKYLTGLASAITRMGGRIFTGTHVENMEGGEHAIALTPRGAVTARHLVIAANTPINNRFVIHTKQAPYTSCVIGIDYPPGSLPHALFWDTKQSPDQHGDSYHYVRTWRDHNHDVLLIGGEDHKTGQHRDFGASFQALEEWARARFPGGNQVSWRWSGQVFEPVDGMAFIGRNPHDADNVYIATGDSGNGLTHGVIAGILITSLIQNRPHPWEELYSPGRISLQTTPGFLQENLNVAAQFRDYFTPGDAPSARDIAPGGGAVLRDGLRKIAAFRDDDGALHCVSAVCPHLKCIVRWNGAERTWDCPCHGSRFDAWGKVLTGPANSNLEPVDAAAAAAPPPPTTSRA